MRALSAEEVGQLRRALEGDRRAVLFGFLPGTGCRPGEALALRWQDLDLEVGRATIRRAATTARGKGRQIQEPKTGGSRRLIPLPASLVVSLTDHGRAQAEKALKLGAAYERNADLVFANEVGGLLELRNTTNRHFKPALEGAKLPKTIRLYDLRHTHVTLLLAAGVRPKVAAERLDHSTTLETLDLDSHLLPGMKGEATAKLEATLGDVG
jgi:integrase